MNRKTRKKWSLSPLKSYVQRNQTFKVFISSLKVELETARGELSKLLEKLRSAEVEEKAQLKSSIQQLERVVETCSKKWWKMKDDYDLWLSSLPFPLSKLG